MHHQRAQSCSCKVISTAIGRWRICATFATALALPTVGAARSYPSYSRIQITKLKHRLIQQIALDDIGGTSASRTGGSGKQMTCAQLIADPLQFGAVQPEPDYSSPRVM